MSADTLAPLVSHRYLATTSTAPCLLFLSKICLSHFYLWSGGDSSYESLWSYRSYSVYDFPFEILRHLLDEWSFRIPSLWFHSFKNTFHIIIIIIWPKWEKDQSVQEISFLLRCMLKSCHSLSKVNPSLYIKKMNEWFLLTVESTDVISILLNFPTAQNV